MKRHQLTATERRALDTYAATYGRTWKQSLRDAWMTASEPGVLQQLRNAAYFGPRGLIAYQPSTDPACRCRPDCQRWLPCDCLCHEQPL